MWNLVRLADAREFETNDDTPVRQGIAIRAVAKPPQQAGRIKVLAFQAIARVDQSPMSERAQDWASLATSADAHAQTPGRSLRSIIPSFSSSRRR